MKSSTVLKSKFRQGAVLMPPLKHWPDRSVEFQWSDSEVVKWLVSNPKIQEFVFDKAKCAGLIKFNEQTMEWVGIEFQ